MERGRKKRGDVSLVIWNPFDDDDVIQSDIGTKTTEGTGEAKQAHAYNPFVGTPPEALPLLVPRMRHSLLTTISAVFFKGIQEELDSLEASLLSPRENPPPAIAPTNHNGSITQRKPASLSAGSYTTITPTSSPVPAKSVNPVPRVHIHEKAKKPPTLSLSTSTEIEIIDREIQRLLQIKEEKKKLQQERDRVFPNEREKERDRGKEKEKEPDREVAHPIVQDNRRAPGSPRERRERPGDRENKGQGLIARAMPLQQPQPARPDLADSWGPSDLCSTRNFDSQWKRQAKAFRTEYSKAKKGDPKQKDTEAKEEPPSVFLNLTGKLQEVKVYADEKSAAAAVKEDTPPLSPRNRRAPTAGAKGALTRSYSIKQLLRKMGSKDDDPKKPSHSSGTVIVGAYRKADAIDREPLSPRQRRFASHERLEGKEERRRPGVNKQSAIALPLTQSSSAILEADYLHPSFGDPGKEEISEQSLNDLTDALLQKIFLMLPPLSLLALSSTNHRLHRIASNSLLWKILHMKNWGSYSITHWNRERLTWQEELRAHQWKELCLIREKSLRLPSTTHYKEERIFCHVSEKISLLMSPEGKVLKADVLGSVHVRCQLNGNLICSVFHSFHNDSNNGGTTGLEDVTLHPIVDGNSFSESQSIVFVPPDNIQVEVMKYRIHDKNSISAPFLVKSSTRENNPNKTIELAISVSSLFARSVTARYVVISTPLPKFVLAPGRKIPVQVTSGHTKIDYQNGQLIWIIKHFPGSRRFLLNAELFQGVARYTRGPIRVEWMKLSTQVSPFQIRWVQVIDEQDNCYTAQKWIRHEAKPGTYVQVN